ncbi:MAG: ABC transporter permease [Bacteriovoracaceae bacterium]
MRSGSYLSILKIVLHGRSAVNILLATVLSFTFSITVILGTFGLMDGFDNMLKQGLRHSSGDLLITHRRGFFSLNENLIHDLGVIHPRSLAPVIQSEAFALYNGESRGVLVRGVEADNFSVVTGLNINLSPQSVVIGEELAKQFHVSIGDEIALTLGRGNESSQSLPGIKLFKISGIVKHGIYQKDLRFVYLNRSELAELLNVGQRVNLLIVGIQDVNRPLEDLTPIVEAQQKVRRIVDEDFFVKPFWNEYSFLLEAVKVEKFSISLILQLIVVVAVFNIIAFVIYIMEKKSQDFFFLRAVGLSLKSLMKFWFLSVVYIWAIACVGAQFLSELLNIGLQYLPFLQIPGEIYVLSSLRLKLDLKAYIIVYALSFLWILLAVFIGYWRLKRRPIIQGLRQEFS